MTVFVAQVVLMRMRQQELAELENKTFKFLSSDSSLQQGRDYQMTLEDSIPCAKAAFFFGPEYDPAACLDLVSTTTLPVATVGAGNSALHGKFEAVLAAIKLDAGIQRWTGYGQTVVGYVSDYGTESKFLEVPCTQSYNAVEIPSICYVGPSDSRDD